MASTIPKIIANFETTLSAKLTSAGTSLTLTSATDPDGNSLASGIYAFTINEGKTNEEHVMGVLSGTTLSFLTRNLSHSDGTTSQTGKEHRKNSSIKITNHPALMRVIRVLQGTDGLDPASPLKYTLAPTLTPGSHQVSTVAYSESLANQGAATASTSTKGIIKVSTAPVDGNNPIAVGDNDPRMPTSNEKTVLTNLTNAVLPYAVDAGSSDDYAVTLSPAPASYTAGMVVNFKANTISTGAATLNVNALGAKTIVKSYNLPLVNGDIKANQIVSVIYDGTNFQLLSPVTVPNYSSGVTTKNLADASGSQTIAHGLGVTPKRIKITAMVTPGDATAITSIGTYNGTTNNAVFSRSNGSSTGSTDGAVIYLIASNGQSATATLDGTNITLSWTKNGAATGTAHLLWEAFA
jgi:hypothetical protein